MFWSSSRVVLDYSSVVTPTVPYPQARAAPTPSSLTHTGAGPSGTSSARAVCRRRYAHLLRRSANSFVNLGEFFC